MLKLVSPPVSAASSAAELQAWLQALAAVEESCRDSPGALAMVAWRREEALRWLDEASSRPEAA